MSKPGDGVSSSLFEDKKDSDPPPMSASSLLKQLSELPPKEKQIFIDAFKESSSDSSSATLKTAGAAAAADLPAVPHYALINSDQLLAGKPHLSIFNGTGNDLSYARWKSEIAALRLSFPEHVVLQEIRRSVRGVAADVMVTLSSVDSVSPILEKFEPIFGNVLPAESILEQFLSAKQKDGESVTQWGLRLEELANLLNQKDPSMLSGEATKTTLRTKFWSGLSNADLRNALRHKRDTSSDFGELLAEARRLVETEFQNPKSAKSHQVTDITPNLAKKLDKLLKLQEGFDERLKQLEAAANGKPGKTGLSQVRYPKPGGNNEKKFNGKCYRCDKWGHPKSMCPLNFSGPAQKGEGLA